MCTYGATYEYAVGEWVGGGCTHIKSAFLFVCVRKCYRWKATAQKFKKTNHISNLNRIMPRKR